MVNTLVPILSTTVVALWIATWLAWPRRPRQGDEVGELVCARRLGQRDRLTLLALIATALLGVLVVVVALT